MAPLVSPCSAGMANGPGVEGSSKGHPGTALEPLDWPPTDLKPHHPNYLTSAWYESHLIIRVILAIYKV